MAHERVVDVKLLYGEQAKLSELPQYLDEQRNWQVKATTSS